MRKKPQPREKTPLEQVSEAACRFIYSQYAVNETANGRDRVSYDCGGEHLVTIYIREDYFDFELDESSRIPVADMKSWEEVRRLILAKKAPDRVPFPKETAVYSRCGMRCDLCVYYTGISEELRGKLKRILGSFWGPEDFGDDMKLCPGCFSKKDSIKCGKLKHARKQKLASCLECGNYPCSDCGHVNLTIQAKNSSSPDVITWALLPYVGGLN